MKELAKLMGYREAVRIIDATLRDGGLVNDFYFTDEFVKALYQTNIKAGVDYMEFGYKASKEMFDESKFGKWKFCKDEDIREIVGENNTDLKIAVMADVGRCDYKNDITDRSDSPIDLIRVATYLNTIPAAVDMIEDAANKGYEVSCNIMAISNSQESDLKLALDVLGQTPVDVFYIVDSFGSLYPEQIARIADIYLEFAEKEIGYPCTQQSAACLCKYNRGSWRRSRLAGRNIRRNGTRSRKLCDGAVAGISPQSEIQRLPCNSVCREVHESVKGRGHSMGI